MRSRFLHKEVLVDLRIPNHDFKIGTSPVQVLCGLCCLSNLPCMVCVKWPSPFSVELGRHEVDLRAMVDQGYHGLFLLPDLHRCLCCRSCPMRSSIVVVHHIFCLWLGRGANKIGYTPLPRGSNVRGERERCTNNDREKELTQTQVEG